MPRFVASSPMSGRNDFFFGGAGAALEALVLSAVWAAPGRAHSATHSQTRTSGARRLTVATLGIRCGGSGGRTQSGSVRPPTSCLGLAFHRSRSGEAAKNRPAHGATGHGLANDTPADGLARDLATHGLTRNLATHRLARDLATYRLARDLATDRLADGLPAHGLADSLPSSATTSCHPQLS